MYVNFSQHNNNIYFRKKQEVPFCGYDARPLKGVLLCVQDESVINELHKIGKKDGFRVFFANAKKTFYTDLLKIKNSIVNSKDYVFDLWAQDNAVLNPTGKILTSDFYGDEIFASVLSKITGAPIKKQKEFIAGGNLYFVKNGLDNEMFIGASDARCRTLENIKKDYNVSKVHVIPQVDYHLDLFVRPLNNKIVLVADDKLMIKEIRRGIKNIETYLNDNICSLEESEKLECLKKDLTNFFKTFKKDVKDCQNPTADDVVKVLDNAGYTAVRVPARVYYPIPNEGQDDLVQSLNYMNAIVHEKQNGDLTYITNKSLLNEKFGISEGISEKIDFDFEKIFLKYLNPYVKKEDVHFISGESNFVPDLLENQAGGIHCLCSEIPAEICKKS